MDLVQITLTRVENGHVVQVATKDGGVSYVAATPDMLRQVIGRVVKEYLAEKKTVMADDKDE